MRASRLAKSWSKSHDQTLDRHCLVEWLLDEKLRAIAGAGFDAVEIFENDLLTFNGSPRDVGRLCRDLGLSVCPRTS